MGNTNGPQGNQMKWNPPPGFAPPGNTSSMPGMPNIPVGVYGDRQGASMNPAASAPPAIAMNQLKNNVQQQSAPAPAIPAPVSGGGRMLGGAVSPIAGMAGPGPAPNMQAPKVQPNAGRVNAQMGPISTRPVARPRRPMGGMV